jgi:hypothetical protein
VYGFLRFPQGYNPELDSLVSKVRSDVLFFPVV